MAYDANGVTSLISPGWGVRTVAPVPGITPSFFMTMWVKQPFYPAFSTNHTYSRCYNAGVAGWSFYQYGNVAQRLTFVDTTLAAKVIDIAGGSIGNVGASPDPDFFGFGINAAGEWVFWRGRPALGVYVSRSGAAGVGMQAGAHDTTTLLINNTGGNSIRSHITRDFRLYAIDSLPTESDFAQILYDNGRANVETPFGELRLWAPLNDGPPGADTSVHVPKSMVGPQWEEFDGGGARQALWVPSGPGHR